MFRKISSVSWEIWGGVFIRAGVLITANMVYIFLPLFALLLVMWYCDSVLTLGLSHASDKINTTSVIVIYDHGCWHFKWKTTHLFLLECLLKETQMIVAFFSMIHHLQRMRKIHYWNMWKFILLWLNWNLILEIGYVQY